MKVNKKRSKPRGNRWTKIATIDVYRKIVRPHKEMIIEVDRTRDGETETTDSVTMLPGDVFTLTYSIEAGAK